MSLPRRVAEAVIASPGITQRELGTLLGVDSGRLSTAVVWLLRNGKLRQDGMPNPAARKLHPTDTTLVDARSLRVRRPPPPPKPPAPRSTVRKGTEMQIVNQQAKRLPSPPNGIETVTEFKARGGVVQVLGPYDSGNPLRFDHSRTEVPPLRRPSQRRRPAAGAI